MWRLSTKHQSHIVTAQTIPAECKLHSIRHHTSNSYFVVCLCFSKSGFFFLILEDFHCHAYMLIMTFWLWNSVSFSLLWNIRNRKVMVDIFWKCISVYDVPIMWWPPLNMCWWKNICHMLTFPFYLFSLSVLFLPAYSINDFINDTYLHVLAVQKYIINHYKFISTY